MGPNLMLVLIAPNPDPGWTGLMLVLTQPILRVKMGSEIAHLIPQSDQHTRSWSHIPRSYGTSDNTPYPTVQITHRIQHTGYIVTDYTPDLTFQMARQISTPDNTQIQHTGYIVTDYTPDLTFQIARQILRFS